MNIWVPKFKILEPKSEIPAYSNVEGLYRLQAVRPDGRVRQDTGWFHNIITDGGLNAMGTTNDYLAQCRVGTGNAAPSALDTALQTQIAATTSVQLVTTGAQATAPYYGWLIRTWRFAAGVAAGNIAEVGVGVPASTLYSRALVLDGGGSPTTITVLSDEFLDVTYQIRIKPPLTDVNSTVNISGVTYNTTTRAMAVTNSSFWANPGQGGGGGTNSWSTGTGAIGAITSSPAGQGSFVNLTNLSYVNLSLQRDFSAQWGLDLSNYAVRHASGGLGTGTNGGMGGMQIEFSPTIPKDNTKILDMTFRHTWARGTP
jgi:hypothetical protein